MYDSVNICEKSSLSYSMYLSGHELRLETVYCCWWRVPLCGGEVPLSMTVGTRSNEIVLRHSQFSENETVMGVCNDGAIVGKSISFGLQN